MPECVKRGTLLVWDAEKPAPVGDWTAVLWRDFGDSSTPGVVSIPRLVETHAEDLKARYLAWIYELGEGRIQDKRIVDHLELRPGLSAWWMSLMVEMSYGKSTGIYEAIRMMAFDSWMAGSFPDRVVIATPNARLAECMRAWCARAGAAFEWQRMQDDAVKPFWAKRLYQSLPHPLQALTWMVRRLFECRSLRGVGLPEWTQTKGRVTFISYLLNLDPDALKEGRFESRYWAHLPDELQAEDCKINCLHLYVKDASLPTASKAAEIIRKFNETGQGGQAHVTLDTFLSARVVIRTLADCGRLAWTSRHLHQALSSSREEALDLWPLFEEDWRSSMSGLTAISNMLFLNLFESALESLPKQRFGVYLQENQGWELTLIHAWKAAGHGRLIGSPHSSVRYWDLRYFFDPRSYFVKGRNDLPLPDQVAVNGTAALNAYLNSGYPAEGIVEVEALRYLHLGDARPESSPSSNGSLRILVLGDYLLDNTRQQMCLLEEAVQHLPEGMIITVKPHPASPIQAEDYPGLKFNVTMEPVSNLLSTCDVAYTSSATSAAVDAYCAGTPVVSVLDPKALNVSPLRGHEGVLFVSTPEELAEALISHISAPRSAKKQQDFFILDSKLPRWRKLLLESVESV